MSTILLSPHQVHLSAEGAVGTQIWDRSTESGEILHGLPSLRSVGGCWPCCGSMDDTGCSGHSYYWQEWLQTKIPEFLDKCPYRSISCTSKYLCTCVWLLVFGVLGRYLVVQLNSKDHLALGWWDDSVGKSTDCSSEGPEFKFQQPYGGSQPPVIRSDALFWCVWRQLQCT